MASSTVRMPEVDVPPDLEHRFAKAWLAASGQPPTPHRNAARGQRYVVIMTPGRTLMMQPCPRPHSMPAGALPAIEKIAPSGRPLNIAVIAFTQLEAVMPKISQAIPFIGYVLGLGYIGHSVVVFEGHPSALQAGCRSADMLIIDEAMLPYLQRDWMTVAWSVMRGPDPRVLVFGRNGAIKRIVKTSGDATGRSVGR